MCRRCEWCGCLVLFKRWWEWKQAMGRYSQTSSGMSAYSKRMGMSRSTSEFSVTPITEQKLKDAGLENILSPTEVANLLTDKSYEEREKYFKPYHAVIAEYRKDLPRPKKPETELTEEQSVSLTQIRALIGLRYMLKDECKLQYYNQMNDEVMKVLQDPNWINEKSKQQMVRKHQSLGMRLAKILRYKLFDDEADISGGDSWKSVDNWKVGEYQNNEYKYHQTERVMMVFRMARSFLNAVHIGIPYTDIGDRFNIVQDGYWPKLERTLPKPKNERRGKKGKGRKPKP